MNTEDFVTYSQALALKKLGFDLNTDYVYISPEHVITRKEFIGAAWYKICDASYPSPTLWEAQKWLRKEKGLYIEVLSKIDVDFFKYTILAVNFGVISEDLEYIYNSPEEALSAGISKCIKLLEQ